MHERKTFYMQLTILPIRFSTCLIRRQHQKASQHAPGTVRLQALWHYRMTQRHSTSEPSSTLQPLPRIFRVTAAGFAARQQARQPRALNKHGRVVFHQHSCTSSKSVQHVGHAKKCISNACRTCSSSAELRRLNAK